MFWLKRAAALLQSLQAGKSITSLRMSRPHGRSLSAISAARRAARPLRTIGPEASRKRRGWLATLNSTWRCGTAGTNHISAFGVWRPGTRRACLRPNRDGQTRWQRPCPAMAAVHARIFDNGDLS